VVRQTELRKMVAFAMINPTGAKATEMFLGLVLGNRINPIAGGRMNLEPIRPLTVIRKTGTGRNGKCYGIHCGSLF